MNEQMQTFLEEIEEMFGTSPIKLEEDADPQYVTYDLGQDDYLRVEFPVEEEESTLRVLARRTRISRNEIEVATFNQDHDLQAIACFVGAYGNL